VSLYCLKFFVVGCSLFGLIVRTPRPWVSLLQFRRTAPAETPRRAPEGGGGSGRDAKKRKKAKMRAVHALQLISTEIDRRNDHQTIDRDAIRFRRMLARIGPPELPDLVLRAGSMGAVWAVFGTRLTNWGAGFDE
jgi:hypothetical protein